MSFLEWNGSEAKRRGDRAMRDFLHAAGVAISNRAKRLLSISGTGKVKGAMRRDERGRFTRMAREITHSKPGEPPYKQTGRLRASVTYEVDEYKFKMRVGTNVEYGRHLELGTSRGLAPRPWLRRAMDESMEKISGIAARLGVHFS